MEIQTLSNLATITRGYSFRSGIDADPTGTIRVVQAGDLSADGFLDPKRASNLVAERRFGQGQYLQAGDVLVAARAAMGMPYRVSIYGQTSGRAVASASLYVVRATSSAVDPAYLAAALRSDAAQQYFQQHSTGSHIRSLTASTLVTLLLHLPPLDYQRTLTQLVAVSDRYQKLQARKIELQTAVIRACVVV